MKQNTDKMILKMILLAIVFVIIASGLYITAGRDIKTLVEMKLNMAVDMGAPVYRYTQEEAQPKSGEIKKSRTKLPAVGSRYGMIYCDAVGLKVPLYYGDSADLLQKGAGQYVGSGLPGEGRPILVGAHDSGYFQPLEQIKKGDRIKVNTSYGEFQYEVTDITVAKASLISQKDLEQPTEELILYTCYPFGIMTGERTERYFVAAQKTAGPVFVEDLNE